MILRFYNSSKSRKMKSRKIEKLTNILFIISLIAFVIVAYSTFARLYPTHPLSSLFCNDDNITRELLDESLTLGTTFLMNNQTSQGNFNYEYDWVNDSMSTSDNQVRQVGALWGMVLIYQAEPSIDLEKSIRRSIEYFRHHSVETADGRKWITYPQEKVGKTGTVALFALSLIDYLRSENRSNTDYGDLLQVELEKYLNFLKTLQQDDGLFSSFYTYQDGRGYNKPSPYSDGEALLAMTKAAKYLGFSDLLPAIRLASEGMYQSHVVEALKEDPDSDTTKGFYQWGSMSFFELATSNWENTEKYGQILIDLADWMIDVHHTLRRTRNTAYAYEGIIHAYQMAKLEGDVKHMRKFGRVIKRGLFKLTSWQVGSSVQNDYLKKHSTTDKRAVGGVMNHRKEPQLRIDVTQHQMHAVILARKYVYPDHEPITITKKKQ